MSLKDVQMKQKNIPDICCQTWQKLYEAPGPSNPEVSVKLISAKNCTLVEYAHSALRLILIKFQIPSTKPTTSMLQGFLKCIA